MKPALSLMLIAGLAGAARAAPQLDPEAPPARWLSEYGLFEDGPRQLPAQGVLPYEVNTPLFTDYALKQRFLYLPPGAHADYRDPQVLELPVGAVLIKTFSYPDDQGVPRPLETRLLVHRAAGWVGWPYVWDHEKGDARLRLAGATLDVRWTRQGQEQQLRYLVPNANDCRKCHARAGDLGPLGPTARNLNLVAGGSNQLQRWGEQGHLQGLPAAAEIPRLARWDDPQSGDLDARARAYLEVNCAHCHRPGGAGDTSGLDLRSGHQRREALGILKPPVAAGRGAGGRRFDVVPGQPEASILLLRMQSTDPGVKMPELGRALVHQEGVALIRDWIAGLTP